MSVAGQQTKKDSAQRFGKAFWICLTASLIFGLLAIASIANYDDGEGVRNFRNGTQVTAAERMRVRLVWCSVISLFFVGTLATYSVKIFDWFKAVALISLLLLLLYGLSEGQSILFTISICISVGFALALILNLKMKVPKLGFAAVSCAAISLGTYWANHTTFHKYDRLIEARNAWPIIDLRPRLTYEYNNVESGVVGSATRQVVKKYLKKIDDQLGPVNRMAKSRAGWLRNFHDEQYERFIRAQGFGVRRMIDPYPELTLLPSIRDIGVHESRSTNEDHLHERPTWDVFFYDDLPSKPIDGDKFVSTHVAGLIDFLDPRSFGYVPEFGRSAGFVPHAFHRPLLEEKGETGIESGKDLKLVSLDLVSLLRFDEPRVYLSEYLPRMDQLSDEEIETRNLSTFEAASLNRLREGEFLVTESTDDSAKMFGAILTQSSCLQCHSSNEGELLGAFSYRFVERVNVSGSID